MRRAAKVDDNQSELVAAMRACGATVALTHMVGDGFPDAVVAFRGRTFLAEFKDGKKPPSKRCLTADQKRFHDSWPGEIRIIESVTQAIDALIGVR